MSDDRRAVADTEFAAEVGTGEVRTSELAVAPPRLVAPGHSAGYVWYAVLLLTVVNVFNAADRTALAVLAPAIKAELQLSDSQLGLLTGLAFALLYATCGIPIARWADRGVRRNIIAIALATWSVMTALCGAAQTFWQLLIARAGVGAGEAGSYSPGASILCDYLPGERRPAIFAIHSFGLVLGLVVGMVLAGWLGERIGWRWTFVAFGAPGLALALVVRLSLREPTRGLFDAGSGARTQMSFGKTIAVLWACPTYRLLTLYVVANAFVQTGFNQWWPSYYTRVVGLNLSSAGAYLGTAIGVGTGIGLLIGGLLGSSRPAHAGDAGKSRLSTCAIVSLLALPALVGSLFVTSVAASLVLVSLAALFWSVPNGPAMAGVFSVTAPQMRATAGALTILMTSILGIGLGPYCVGFLSDVLREPFGDQSLRYALLAPASVVPLCSVGLIAAARTFSRDVQMIAADRPRATGT
jgi:predicted MFS family arabinose efflux permease